MELRFKPKFLRDLRRISDKQSTDAAASIILKIESAKTLSQIPNLKKLEKYHTLYRIKIKLDAKRDYRMVLSIRGETIWAERILHREDVYEYFRR